MKRVLPFVTTFGGTLRGDAVGVLPDDDTTRFGVFDGVGVLDSDFEASLDFWLVSSSTSSPSSSSSCGSTWYMQIT